MLKVRSEIGPYRHPSQRDLVLPKNNHNRHPMQSSFPSTDSASQGRRSEGAPESTLEMEPRSTHLPPFRAGSIFYAFPGDPLRSIRQSPDYQPGAPSALKSKRFRLRSKTG